QLAGVPDPPPSEVEDWLREDEQKREAVTRDTLKWAKIAGRAAIIGVVVTAVVGIGGIIIGLRGCSYAVSNYNNENRLRLRFGEWIVKGIGNDLFFAIHVAN